jgi:threonine/homoserine/homoserine lactone efflux protein
MLDLIPFTLFATVASITPGPTNILILGHSLRHGLRGAMPLVLGACMSAAAIVWAVGAGIGDVLITHASLQIAMKWMGIAWLTYLAWQLFRSAPTLAPDGTEARLGFSTAAGLQLVNPKVWMMALAVVSVFARPGADATQHVAILAAIFFCVSLPCLGLWALLGRSAARFLTSSQHIQRFNRGLAVLLLVSAWAALLP